MPFSETSEKHSEDYWTNFFSEFLKPEVENLGYKCERSKALPANIINNIIKQLNEADVVIAVLTDFNANVWYELGIRHSLKKGTIMIIESGQKPPFDIASYGYIKYVDKIEAVAAFKDELKSFIEKIESNTHVDNPVQDFIYKENLYINRTSLAKANELLDGISWVNVPLAQLIAFHEPKFRFLFLNKESYKALDVGGALRRNKAPIKVYTPNNGENQIWEIRHRIGTTCSIVAMHSGKCLEVKDRSNDNSALIQQNEYTGATNQLWEIVSNNDGSYRILQASGKCIEADFQTVRMEGGRVILHDYTEANHQKWVLQPIPIKFS